MKCPKCGYIGFEAGNRCRNCGYDFSLSQESGARSASAGTPEPFPLDELDLQEEQAPRPRRHAAAAADDLDRIFRPSSQPPADLPLFVEDVEVRRPEPAKAVRPLSVRRATPPPQRARVQRETVERRPEPGELALEPAAPLREPTPTVPQARQEMLLAGGARRLLAAAIDLTLLLAMNLVVVHLTLRMCRISFAEVALVATLPMAAFLLLLTGGYLVLFTTVGGQTIGKMATGIRVVADAGDVPVGLGPAVLRTLAYSASFLPAGMGFLPAVLGQSQRALHDRIAGTRVIRL
ncbi:MAG: RDD family protein [Vicinamibacterales bacterium]